MPEHPVIYACSCGRLFIDTPFDDESDFFTSHKGGDHDVKPYNLSAGPYSGCLDGEDVSAWEGVHHVSGERIEAAKYRSGEIRRIDPEQFKGVEEGHFRKIRESRSWLSTVHE